MQKYAKIIAVSILCLMLASCSQRIKPLRPYPLPNGLAIEATHMDFLFLYDPVNKRIIKVITTPGKERVYVIDSTLTMRGGAQ
ncbi:hypothetical protein [Rhodoflexus caldus]|uniref:hypothetical protein n=1 Tax=Rhodoflexus caldus TaxID=2891236 RepID=UPI002029D001|nr:hypothetical protein [Rhodoflexus caldus]